MKKNYPTVEEFKTAVHEELELKQLVLDMDLVKKEDFRGDFISCIFHEGDNTPSLQITDHYFRCYACGAKGDIFKFIELKFNMTFLEAVKHLAQFLGITIENMNLQYDGKIERLAREWEAFQKNMSNLDPALALSLRRDFFPEIIGYDPVEKMTVLALTSKTGAVLGFTKRRIDKLHRECGWMKGDKFTRPKWKHSSLDDSLLGLCHNIFNLYQANLEMKKKDEVVITEGPKDVIAYKRINVQNAICVCGTSNSNNTFDSILPIGRIVLSMDGDTEGKKATASTIMYLAKVFDIRKVFVVVLPEGKDPYDITSDELQAAYNNPVQAANFFVAYNRENSQNVADLYNTLQEFNVYNCPFLMKAICKEMSMTVSEAESWIKPKKKLSDPDGEKEKLIAIARGEDVPVGGIDPRKAKRILELKYGWKE